MTGKYFCMIMKKLYILIFLAVAVACGRSQRQPIDYADPFIGTGDHGHTYPGASAPFGAVQLSPDTRTGDWDACSGYHYSDSSIIGFSHTHLSGTGCADLGDILFHPATHEIEVSGGRYVFEPLAFSHDDESASPGYYSVYFREEGIKAELTATTYAGMHRYTFAQGKPSNLVIDLMHCLTDETVDVAAIRVTAPNEIRGMRRTQGWVDNQYLFFATRFSRDIVTAETVENPAGVAGGMSLGFGLSDGEPLVITVGLSVVSEENALANLTHDIAGFDFDAVHAGTRAQWSDALSLITVEGGTDAELTNFYTALYHAQLVPNIVSDANGEYRCHDMTIGRLPKGGRRYSTFSIWDTFRAWNPLMTLLNTELVSDMINSYLDMYDVTGELPIWPLSSGETRTMIGYHAVSVIADAYLRGIDGFDVEKAYEAMKRSSDINKKGSDYYVKYGFIPSNVKKESVSCVLEYAYDDWCIAQMAKSLGYDDDYAYYMERADNYANVFDGYTRFFRGKRMDGNWDIPFNPYEPGRAYTEATAWQYRFFAPHDVNGMIELFGGVRVFSVRLDSLFTADSAIDGHMSDITGLIGQYAQGNEPSHHMAYLYNYTGEPWKTQAMTRRILRELYQPLPDGISGNEDCGQMSAWYILTSLGIYPVCPGSGQFSLTSPLFEKAVIRLANGKTLTVKANNPAKNSYIRRVVLNGREIAANYVTYDDLMQGGELEFVLGHTLDTLRGTSPDAAPYSMTTGRIVSTPYITRDLDQFTGSVEVVMGCATDGAEIYYTLDGSVPDETSARYTSPFVLDKSATIRAKAFLDGSAPSRVFTISATKAVLRKGRSSASGEHGTNFKYYEGYFSAVADIEMKGSLKASGSMSAPSITDASQEDHFGYIFMGLIYAPEDGVYEFMTRSDDGSVLYVAGEKVVDNDGSHAAITATGRIALEKGYHPYRLMYFEDYEGEELSWGWRRPSDSVFEDIPAGNLFLR